jgi:hypothetical protein
MKPKSILMFVLAFSIQQSYGQLEVKSSGKIIGGPTTTWADYILNITGSGTNGSNGKIGFGNNTTSVLNVLVGEYGSTDTDQLLLHGDDGIFFSTSESIDNKMYLDGNGKLGIKTTSPTGYLQVGTMSTHNNYMTSFGADFRICRYSSTGFAYLQAMDNTSSDIGLYIRSQDNGNIVNALKIDPDGTVTALVDFIDDSDLRRKTDIRSLSNEEISGIFNLNVINYVPVQHDSIPIPDKRRKFGLIAQEVKEVYPDLVHEGSDGFLGVSYMGIIPILVEAIKEQQLLIENLQYDLDQMKSDNNLKSETRVNPTDGSHESAILYQNSPNPFNEISEIKFYIPEGTHKASIYIYDLQGQQKKVYNIASRDQSSIQINSYELLPGQYLYSLIVDDSEVSTKRMIITE